MRAWRAFLRGIPLWWMDQLWETPRRTAGERQRAWSRDRPQAAAERSEDRARTVAQPSPWTAKRASQASIKRRCQGRSTAAVRRHNEQTRCRARRRGAVTIG